MDKNKQVVDFTGGSDGARTRDLRRDRPQSSQEFLTGVPTFANPQGAANRLEVGTGYPPPPDPENDSAAGARNTHGAKNIEVHSDELNNRAESGAQASFPLITGEWPKNKRESVRVALDEFQGRKIIDCRVWWRDDDGVLRPGKAGLTLAIKHAPNLADALAKALVRARELGLVDDGDAQ